MRKSKRPEAPSDHIPAILFNRSNRPARSAPTDVGRDGQRDYAIHLGLEAHDLFRQCDLAREFGGAIRTSFQL